MGLVKNMYLKYRIKWFCDNCEKHMNDQTGFNTKTGRWICTSCGYENDVTAEYVGKGNKLKQQREELRKNTECLFENNISYEVFCNLADSIKEPIERLHIDVSGAFVTGKVTTISGIDEWEFKVDFNDFGKITGKYWWVYCENLDSKIPNIFAEKLSKIIVNENKKASK